MSGFDLCACLNGNDLMIQRLLSILRQSQEYCTDNECLTPPSLPASTAQNQPAQFMMVCLLMIFAMLMYALRPNSLRQFNQINIGKGRDSDADSNGEPPLPPPSVN